MHFIKPEQDEALLRELFAEGVITNKDYGAFDLPVEGWLMDALRKNTTRISSEKWCLWLLKRYGYHRIPDPMVDLLELQKMSFNQADCISTRAHDAYPLNVFGGQLVLGCARPSADLKWEESLRQRSRSQQIVKLALTLDESQKIQTLLEAEFGRIQ